MTNFAPEKSLEPGSLIANRYQVQRVLGSGGMGFVYLATDSLLGDEKVAVKVLHSGYCDDKVQTARFLREVQLMRKVNHKNVVRTYDVGTDETQIYFTMEFVPGRQLQDLIGDRGLPLDEVPKLIAQMCEGLQAIHGAGIVHRDLKPGNIIVLPDGTLRITDFGVARPEVSTLTAHDEIVGSVCYMAPEMWLGQAITPAVDLYALGIIIYEMCTGDVPFDGDSPAALMRLHLDREPVPPRDKNTRVPPWLNKLVLRLLAKPVQERPRDAREILDYVRTHAGSTSLGPLATDSAKTAASHFLNDLETGFRNQETGKLKTPESTKAVSTGDEPAQRVRRRTFGNRGVSPEAMIAAASGTKPVETKRSGLAGKFAWLLVVAGAVFLCALGDKAILPLVHLSGRAADSESLWNAIELATGPAAGRTQQELIHIGVLRVGVVAIQLCLPIILLGALLRSSAQALRLLARSFFTLLFAGLIIALYFLYPSFIAHNVTSASVLAAAITAKDQLSSIALLVPFTNIYEQIKFPEGVMQSAIGCYPLRHALVVSGLLLVYLVALFSASDTSGAPKRKFRSVLLPALFFLLIIGLEGMFTGSGKSLAWQDYFGVNLRLSVRALLFGVFNWSLMALWIFKKQSKN